jgi:hypothetical protein
MQATWMVRAANENYLPVKQENPYIAHMRDAYKAATDELDTFIVNQDYTLNMGIVHAALNAETYEFQSRAQSFVYDWICGGGRTEKVDYTKFGRAFTEASPLIGDTVLAAGLAQIYALKTKVPQLLFV